MSTDERLSPSELQRLRVAFNRDCWAGEFNDVPTEVDRILTERAAPAPAADVPDGGGR